MTVFLDDGDVQLHHGDVIQTLRSLPAGIAQTCITSPPYWGLRDYGTGEWTGGDDGCDHGPSAQPRGDRPANGLTGGKATIDAATITRGDCRCGARRVDSQLGLEATPDLYVERMVAVFREVWRVLRADGTVWLNLGDSYASGNGGDTRSGLNERYFGKPSIKDKQGATNAQLPRFDRPPGLKPKDLVGIPWRVAFALQADGWYLRSDIVWSKPNPMPESVSDRPTKAHEYLFLLAKQPRYFYDADAIREPHNHDSFRASKAGHAGAMYDCWEDRYGFRGDGGLGRGSDHRLHEAGRNRRSVWTIPTEPFPEAHFATYPQALVRPCIQAGTSEHGECSSCGSPWVRETETTYTPGGNGGSHGKIGDGRRDPQRRTDLPTERLTRHDQTTGWSASCTCDAPTRPQTVLDPFIGSGTTALVARNHGRRCIGIDLSAEYLAIAAKRLQQLSLLAEVDLA